MKRGHENRSSWTMEIDRIICLLTLFLVNEVTSARNSFFSQSESDFRVYWNVPTFMCHRYGLDFSEVGTRWGIVQNAGDTFRGNNVVILYDPGEFPALMHQPNGKLVPRNGGVPQEGDLDKHLKLMRTQIEDMIPDRNFKGIGVIDFEAWRPIWRQNWASLLPYRELSRKIEKRLHPFWSSDRIEAEAEKRFERAAKDFLKETLELVRQMRPNGQWGYYTFPYCFNFTPKNMHPSCPAEVQRENDRIQWLFDGSTALYPSLYLSKYRMTPDQHAQFVKGRLMETIRMAEKTPRLATPPIYPYIWYRYHDAEEFLSEEDLLNSLVISRQMGSNGAVIWGSANDTNTRGKCEALRDYLHNVLGPAVQKVSSSQRFYENPTTVRPLLRFLHDLILG